jgi:hypothetical protein
VHIGVKNDFLMAPSRQQVLSRRGFAMHIHIIIRTQFSRRRPPLGLDQSFSFVHIERRVTHMDKKTKTKIRNDDFF